jgi:hypothetical protein
MAAAGWAQRMIAGNCRLRLDTSLPGCLHLPCELRLRGRSPGSLHLDGTVRAGPA